MPQIIHISNPGRGGRALEDFERRCREALDQGFSIAPLPADGRVHRKINRYSDFKACPTCSFESKEKRS